jgi:hypothetical protein
MGLEEFSSRSPGSVPQSPLFGSAPQERERQEKSVCDFIYWAATRWDTVQKLFTRNDMYKHKVGGQLRRKGITAQEWVDYIYEKGFRGDSMPVFIMILDELPAGEDDTINMSQLLHFKKRVATELKGNGTSPAAEQLMEMMKKKYGGSLLRAWRCELDPRSRGWATSKDFSNACSRFGFLHFSKILWEQLGMTGREQLQLSDVSGEDAANVVNFLECLDMNLGLNFEEAWSFMDVQHQNWVSFDEFFKFSSKLGFTGDARMLFNGLDSHNTGRIHPEDFAYLRTFLVRAGQHADDTSAFTGWVRRNFYDTGAFMQALGQKGEWVLSCKDFATLLVGLGYTGDPLATARQLSLLDSGLHQGVKVSRVQVCIALAQTQSVRICRPVSRDKPGTKFSQKPEKWTRALHNKGWDSAVEDISAANELKGLGTKKLFSPPERLGPTRATSPTRARAARAPGANLQVRESLSLKQDQDKAKTRPIVQTSRPAWNNSLYTDELNKVLPAASRTYFNEKEKPLLESLRAKKKQTQVVLWAPGPTRLSRAMSEQWFASLGYQDEKPTSRLE